MSKDYRKAWRDKHKDYNEVYYEVHKEEIKARSRNYSKHHRKERRAYLKAKRKLQRKECINHYGGLCACCGENRIEFLAIDHIGGGGNKHRKEHKIVDLLLWLIKNGFPEGFRVLCHNCNLSLGFYGYCPHEKEKV